jgi:cytoskeleton protein RodZ
MNANVGTGDAAPRTSGASLTAAREAAGLSIDAVAQQLKLHPRQVRALEDGDYTHLPGRTFVRGFLRNYARLLRLDAEKLLRELPAATTSPALEAPTLSPTAPTIGELPTSEHGKPGWARWVIPAVLAGVVIAAAVYEWQRLAGAPQEPRAAETGTAAGSAAPAPAAQAPPQSAPQAAIPASPAAAPPASPGAPMPDGGTPLPNPFAAAPPAASLPAAAPPSGTASNAAPARAAESAAASSEPAAAAVAARSAGAAVEATLVLSFRDFSWTEVRDRDGRLIFARMNPGGTSQTIAGVPPLAVVIGNAADVRARYRNRPLDLAPHTRANVARFTLQ